MRDTSAVMHAIWNMKMRLLRHGCVANPRHSWAMAVVCALP